MESAASLGRVNPNYYNFAENIRPSEEVKEKFKIALACAVLTATAAVVGEQFLELTVSFFESVVDMNGITATDLSVIFKGAEWRAMAFSTHNFFISIYTLAANAPQQLSQKMYKGLELLKIGAEVGRFWASAISGLKFLSDLTKTKLMATSKVLGKVSFLLTGVLSTIHTVGRYKKVGELYSKIERIANDVIFKSSTTKSADANKNIFFLLLSREKEGLSARAWFSTLTTVQSALQATVYVPLGIASLMVTGFTPIGWVVAAIVVADCSISLSLFAYRYYKCRNKGREHQNNLANTIAERMSNSLNFEKLKLKGFCKICVQKKLTLPNNKKLEENDSSETKILFKFKSIIEDSLRSHQIVSELPDVFDINAIATNTRYAGGTSLLEQTLKCIIEKE